MNGIPDEILNQFRDCFDNQERQVQAIDRYLIDDVTRSLMKEHGLTTRDILECTYARTQVPAADRIRGLWNRRLGFKSFLEDESTDIGMMENAIMKAFGQMPRRA